MPDVQSPIFRIDLTDSTVVEALNNHLRQESASYENGAAYRAPEILRERRDTYTPGLIQALLDSGEVNLWDYQKGLPEYPRLGSGFGTACRFLHDVSGVQLVEPSKA